MQILKQHKDIIIYSFGGETIFVGYTHKGETTATFMHTSMRKCENRFKKYVACAYPEAK